MKDLEIKTTTYASITIKGTLDEEMEARLGIENLSGYNATFIKRSAAIEIIQHLMELFYISNEELRDYQ